MSIKDILPWKKEDKKEIEERSIDPIENIQKRMDSLFDDFFDGFGDLGFSRDKAPGFSPRIDLSESEREIVVTAELPGIGEEDLNVSLADGMLTIHGEKKSESEEKKSNYYRLERSYGSFRRVIPLPAEVVEENIDANYKNGVLRIRLPKTDDAAARRKRIKIHSG